MIKMISALCFMFALSPLAYAQDKAKTDDKKAAPAAEKKAAPAAEKKAAPAAEKAKKEPSEKQKAQQERMKSCNDKATDKNGYSGYDTLRVVTAPRPSSVAYLIRHAPFR